MSNLFGNLRRSSSSHSINRMENDLKMLEKNTSKFENQLMFQNNISKTGKCPGKKKKDIYQIGTFDFRSTYKIEVSENTHYIGSETETIELLNPKDIEF